MLKGGFCSESTTALILFPKVVIHLVSTKNRNLQSVKFIQHAYGQIILDCQPNLIQAAADNELCVCAPKLALATGHDS